MGCRRWLRQLLFGVAAALLAAGAVQSRAAAEAVRIEHLGLELAGNLEPSAAGKPVAGTVVLIVHDALSYHGAEGPRALQAGLAARSIPSLAITLSLGLDARQQSFECAFEHDHRDADAAQEIAAWTSWLVERGAKAVILVGDGFGSLQVAIEPDPPHSLVRGLVLIAPPPTDPAALAADYRTRFQADLAALIAEAHRVGADTGEDTSIDVPGFLVCGRSRVTVGAFLDAYDRSGRPDLAAGLRQRPLPALVFLPRDDRRRADFTSPGIPPAGDARVDVELLSTGVAGADPARGQNLAARIADFAARVAP